MAEPTLILVVEDEPTMLRLVQEALVDAGHKVIAATNGAAGLKAFQTNSAEIKLVITDLMMPKLNGVEMARMIRRESPTVPILFISGYADDLVFEDEVMKGPTMFMPKPFRQDTLVDEVASILEG
jgi:two-component system, cell cycle sensor histidine kinase and response regulator CckA